MLIPLSVFGDSTKTEIRESYANFVHRTSDSADSLLLMIDKSDAPQKQLRTAIIRFADQFETDPLLAVKLYTRLAESYEANGDSLWSDRVHCEKIQYYLIKDFLFRNKNNAIGLKALEDYKLARYLDDQYYQFQHNNDERRIDKVELDEYDKVYIDQAELDGKNMEEIGAIDEAEWCYKYWIRLSKKYRSPFSESIMCAYMDLLKLYATHNDVESFNELFPTVSTYANEGLFARYNEFYLAKIFGKVFSDIGNKKQAFDCYKKCFAFLDSGEHIEDELNQKISLYMNYMAVCNDLGFFQDALGCSVYLESNLSKADIKRLSDYKFNLFVALLGLSEYEKSLCVINEVEQLLTNINKSSDSFYYSVCMFKGINLLMLGHEEEARLQFKSMYEQLWVNHNAIAGLEETIYPNLAFYLMSLGEYQMALTLLETIAEIDLKTSGKISSSVQNDIDECKKHL